MRNRKGAYLISLKGEIFYLEGIGAELNGTKDFFELLSIIVDDENDVKRLSSFIHSICDLKLSEGEITDISVKGELLSFNVRRMHGEEGRKDVLLAQFQDADAEKETRYDVIVASLTEHTMQPACIFEESGRIVRVNVALSDLSGCTRKQLEKNNLYGMIDLSIDSLKAFQRKKSLRFYDRTLMLPNGRRLPIEVTIGKITEDGNDKLYYAYITDLRLWQEKEFLKRRMSLLTRQRSISTDLHDNVAQNLVLLKMKCDQMLPLLSDDLSEGLVRDFVTCRKLLDETQDKIRGTIRQLREDDSVLEEDCLWGVDEVLNYASEVLELEIVDMGLSKLSKQTQKIQMQLCQLMREALINVYKHAKTSLVWLTVVEDGEKLILTIIDKGAGFENLDSSEGHYGITIMKERMKECGGEFKIISKVGGGTEVIATLPVSD